MKSKSMLVLLSLLLVVAVLAACAQPTATPVPPTKAAAPAATVVPTKAAAPAATAVPPTAVPPTAVPKPAYDTAIYGDLENLDLKGVKVTWWHQHTQQREKDAQKLVADFNASNPYGIVVSAEYAGGYSDIYKKMTTGCASGDVPGLVVAYQNQQASYATAKCLVELTPYVNSPKWGFTKAEQADFFPGFWAQDQLPQFNAGRYGIPPNRSIEVLYYNADWLKELGYSAPPTDWKQFKEMACKATKTPFSKGPTDGKQIGYQLSIDASRFASWTFSNGGNIYDYKTNQFILDNAKAVEAMKMLQDLYKEGCARTVAQAYEDQNDFGAGKLLFTVGSTSGLPFYKTVVDAGAKFNWSVAAIPHTTADPVMNVYGASIAVPKTKPQQQLAAFLFLKWMVEPKQQAEWVKASMYFPTRASVAANLTDFLATNPAFKAGYDLLKYAIAEPPVSGYDPIRTEMGKSMTAIVGGADAASTLATLNVKANQLLKEAAPQ